MGAAWLEIAWVGLVGLAVGSFLNVCIHRMPQGWSVWRPPSACPVCTHPIRWRDNVPVLSWVLLRGRCRDCGERISSQYPLVELLTAGLVISAYQQFGWSGAFPYHTTFLAALVAGGMIDRRHGVLPDSITLGGTLVGIVGAPAGQAAAGMAPTVMAGALAGALVTAIVLLLVRAVGTLVYRRESMGLGDVKLGAMLGAFLGWPRALLAVYLGYCLTLMAVLMRRRRVPASPAEELHTGPFFAVGGVISLFAGKALLARIFGG